MITTTSPASPSRKRATVLWLVLGMGAFGGCSVETAGLGAAQEGKGGMSATGGKEAGGQGTGGAADSDGGRAPDGASQPADTVLGSGGISGTGGTWGTGGIIALDAAPGTGGGKGMGGLVASDGALPNGGSPGTGGASGMGGATGEGGATTPDGSADVAEAQPRDLPLESGPDLGPDLGNSDEPAPDTSPDTRDAPGVADLPPAEAHPPLPLVWSDEFNAATKTGVDTNKWNTVVWPPGEVNNEKQQYTASLNNVFHDGDGHLIIRGLYKPMAVNSYSSGRIDTKGKVSFGPGHRIEVRAKLPAGIGSFPGIVMMGSTGDWPACGQLSLMEQYGQDKSLFYSTIHAGNAPGSGTTDKTSYSFATATTASEDFHLYSLDWYSDHVVFQVDGEEILRKKYAPSSPLYNITEYVILDVALGGDMGGTIDNSAFPMDMVIDFIRVYEL